LLIVAKVRVVIEGGLESFRQDVVDAPEIGEVIKDQGLGFAQSIKQLSSPPGFTNPIHIGKRNGLNPEQ
jgi:hypothetical protein